MSEVLETIDLPAQSPGTRRSLTLHRFGDARRGKKVYLQAALHANEMPGVLVLQHLLPLLRGAEAEGRLLAEVVLVPLANPLGFSQWAFQQPLGRYDADSLQNFNRGFPDLAALCAENLAPRLGPDAGANQATIRAAFRQALAQARARALGEVEALQLALLSLSCDADIVLDLHCDHRACLHFYASPAQPQLTRLLGQATGAKLALIEAVSGGNAFDEAHTAPWAALQSRFPAHPIPAACFSTTLEYRGQFDVDDATAASDAANLMTFLAAAGMVTGWPDAPAHDAAPERPLGGALEVFAPCGGLVTWELAPGAEVAAGQVLGHVTDPTTGTRLPIASPCPGLFFRAELWVMALRGQSLAHVAGETVLRVGDLLSN